MKKIYHKQTLKPRLSRVLLFPFAFLVLIMSCPVKKLVYADHLQVLSGAKKASHPSVRNSGQVVYDQLMSCKNISADRDLLSVKKSVVKVVSPVYLSNAFEVSGAALKKYLSGAGTHGFLPEMSPHSLPLFLQYRSLII